MFQNCSKSEYNSVLGGRSISDRPHLTNLYRKKMPRERHSYHIFFVFFFPVSASMTLTAASAYTGYDRAFCVRMKSTLTKRGCHFKSSGYRVRIFFFTYYF